MPKHVLLNNIAHKDLRVSMRRGAACGDNVGTIVTFPTEYADVQREYPIFFRKDAKTGEFSSIALLGFQQDENLFLDGERWDAAYIPGALAKGPFLIGFQERSEGGELQREPVIHVDMDDPRVNTTEGEAVFLERGGRSPYLQRIVSILDGINRGIAASGPMFAAFTALDLIEPVNVDIKMSESEEYQLLGLHTISEERLNALDAQSLHRLHQSRFLQGAFLVIASLNNVKKLIDLKFKRRRLRDAG